MTVVLGVASDDWSILATDTRITFKDNHDKMYDDSVVKLKSLNYPHGWYAGTGYSHYLDALYHLASRSLISSSEQYLDAMAQVITELIQAQNHDISGIMKSVFARTFINSDQINLEIFFVNQSTGQTNAYNCPKDKLLILFPSDYTLEMQAFLNEKYQIENYKQDSFENNLVKILNIFKDITTDSIGVSEICEIGIMKKDGLIKKFSISGNVHELIVQAKESNYLASLF